MAVNPNTDFSAGNVLTAAQQNRFPRGVVAENSTTTTYTTTNSYVDVLACSSFTAVTNRLYQVTFTSSSAGYATAGSRIAVKLLRNSSIITIGYQGTNATGVVLEVTGLFVATGATVVKAQAKYDIGSSSDLYADVNSPMRLWVEDLGPY